MNSPRPTPRVLAFLLAIVGIVLPMLSANPAPCSAQDKLTRHQSKTLNEQTVVVIEVEGNINISSWKEQYLMATTATERTGKIWGWSNEQERAPYDVALQQDKDTLFIRPQVRPELWVVGIATINENITQTFFVPGHAKVLVRSKKAAIRAQGMFTGFEAICNEGNITMQVIENQLHFLNIQASTITVNQTPLNKQYYRLENKGTALYLVESRKGNVEVMLLP